MSYKCVMCKSYGSWLKCSGCEQDDEYEEAEWIKEHDAKIRKELVDKMKSRFFHMVGTEFDNAILEMERMAYQMNQN